ncbi:hypothetical protein H7X87_02775, partial [Acetobacteraceae bacterium]|nr:hypothetical protein [Candidatus Parcubacteria bacterium]
MSNLSPTLRDLIAKALKEAKVLTLRDVTAGEEPFLYSSGNHEPGYLMFKGLVSRSLMKAFCHHLAHKVLEQFPDVEY